MANSKFSEIPIVSDFTDEDFVTAVTGGLPSRIPVKDLKKGMIKNNDLYLQQVAFFIDINEPPDTPKNVNVGGNMQMFKLWANEWKSGVMDQDGNWAELSRTDNRYFADGTLVVNLETGEVIPELANCNFIGVIPETGCYIQTVQIADKTIQRLWLSLLPLPGWTEPAQYTGMFKGWIDESGRLRALPGKVPTGSKTNKQFWDAAQLYGRNYGLAGVYFRNMLLWYMMGAYGQRSSQECKLSDGTPVFGVGLDGSESTGTDKFVAQKNIKTGTTLALGTADGKIDVKDVDNNVCHSVKVLSYENPWGQYWEFDGHLCSFAGDVFAWRENFMPTTNNPAKTDFANIKITLLARHKTGIGPGDSSGHKMNILSGSEQGLFMIPYAPLPGVSYGDGFWYAEAGQVWLWGGNSGNGSDCGLASSYSGSVWSISGSNIGSRLAYFGPIKVVSGKALLP